MDIKRLENARAAMAKVKAIEIMIADIDSLRGNGAVHNVSGKYDRHGDPTFKTVLTLDKLYEKLNIAKEEAADAYQSAVDMLESIQDEEMHQILFLRHMKRYTWEQIARHFGEWCTADAVKQRHSRYVRRNCAG